jgi:hypothetical protein
MTPDEHLCEARSVRNIKLAALGMSLRYSAATQEWAVFQAGERITDWNKDETVSFLQALHRNPWPK